MGTFTSAEIPGRLPGVSVQALLADEHEHGRPIPAGLREEFNDFTHGRTGIDVARYVTREFYDLEMDRLWSRTWQWACRTDELATVGDHVIYEIGDTSLIVVRSSPTEIKAFHNACLHRGRTLRDEAGNVTNLRCPFHGFAWGLDGQLKNIPEAWDFGHVEWDRFCLPEATVGVWGGFVFVNLDLDAPPLEDHLGGLTEHLAPWDFEHRFTAAHLGKVLPANWKVALEAFLENMHASTTHPQALKALGDSNMQYDAAVDRGEWGRMIGLLGTPSPHLAGAAVSEQDVLDTFYAIAVGGDAPTLPVGMTARQCAAELVRGQLKQYTGKDLSHVSDSEMIDLIVYHVFPNLEIFGGYGGLVYRFRPWGGDHQQCLWEIVMLLPVADGAVAPPPAKLRMLASDEGWVDAPELGVIGQFLQQDLDNIPHVQRGLRAMRRPMVTWSVYLESLVRHFHHRLDGYLGIGDHAAAVD
jgi:phenylpropionate dioxygenase-like ring-hydroxylating dioxygenase large terminal subunit